MVRVGFFCLSVTTEMHEPDAKDTAEQDFVPLTQHHAGHVVEGFRARRGWPVTLPFGAELLCSVGERSPA